MELLTLMKQRAARNEGMKALHVVTRSGAEARRSEFRTVLFSHPRIRYRIPSGYYLL